MSVTVAVKFEGTALAERPSRNVAERICKAIEGELAGIGGLNWSHESKEERRPFLGDEPFSPMGRTVEVAFGYHVNDEPTSDPQP